MSIISSDGRTGLYLELARAMKEVGCPETLHSLLRLLQEMLERDVPQIDRLLSLGDAGGANQLLHTMKGCLPIFCGPALCEELAQVEQLSKAGGKAGLIEAYAQLMPKLVGLQSEVVQHLAQTPAVDRAEPRSERQ